MDKKTLRKHPLPELSFKNKTFDNSYVAYARIEKIIDEELLIIYIFSTKLWDGTIKEKKLKEPKLSFRVFVNKEGFLTQKYEDLSKKITWSSGTISYLLGNYWFNGYNSRKPADYYDEESRTCGIDFLQSTEECTLFALNKFQANLRALALTERRRRTQKETDEIMARFGELPTDIEACSRNVAFKHSRYIFYKREGKKINGLCSVCGHEVVLEVAKHNKKGVCPHCKQAVMLKAKGKATMVRDTSSISVINSANGALLVRHLELNRYYYGYQFSTRKLVLQPEVRAHERYRFIIEGGKIKTFQQTNDYRSNYKWVWREEKNFDPTEYYYYAPAIKSFLYTMNLKKELHGTPWKYSQIGEYARAIKEEFSVMGYLKQYYYKPVIEYLFKLGLTNLLEEVLRGHEERGSMDIYGKTLKQVLMFNKNELRFIQENNLNSAEIKLFRICQEKKYKVDINFIKWTSKYDIYKAFLILKFTTPTKTLNYLNKQRDYDIRYALSDWADYLETAEQIGYNTKSDSTLFPKNLKRAHDKVMLMKKQKRVEHLDGIIKAQEEQLNKLFKLEGEKLIIRAPKSAKEIVAEGSSLGHCVGGYVEKVAKNETTILFVRRASRPNKPFYTIEYNTKDVKVMQCRGKSNCNMTDEVKQFVKQWEEAVNKKLKRKKMKIGA